MSGTDLDQAVMPWNTAEARAARVNAPAPYARLEIATYPHEVPAALRTFVADARVLSPPRSLILHGKQGAGKTALGIILLQMFAAAGAGSLFQWNVLTAPRRVPDAPGEEAEPSPCWFERWSRILARNRREHWDEEGWFEQLENVTVLLLDDISVETGTQYRKTLLLRHLEWAEDRDDRQLILTLNEGSREWADILGERVADRMQEQRRFLSVLVSGASLR